MKPINDYYERLAEDYDRVRFGNSYGRYLDHQERAVLRAWLSGTRPEDVIDLGCGTGRLLDFAMTGVDASKAMLKVAARKFTNRRLIHAGLAEVGSAVEGRFQAAICFHLFMHLEEQVIADSLQSIAQVVKGGGRLILDIPSKHRRALNRRRPGGSGWHGNTAAARDDIERWAGPHWRILRHRGILFFPIHRLPSIARPLFRGLDDWLGRSPLGRFSSYHVYELERRT